MKTLINLLLIASSVSALASGPYDGAAGTPGSKAIAANDPRFVEWASGATINRGLMDIAKPTGGYASYGTASSALGASNSNVVSLGDGGSAILTFDKVIGNGEGADFAVFENGFSDTFLELGFVEVSSNGTDFFRFDSVSLTQTSTQVGGFGTLDPTNLNNLAGKYRAGYGTGFDLAELAGRSPLLDVNNVKFVKIIDVIGTINPTYASRDSLGNIINDPYSTPFASGGFDLDAVGVIHTAPVPEPTSLACLGVGVLALIRRRRSASRD